MASQHGRDARVTNKFSNSKRQRRIPLLAFPTFVPGEMLEILKFHALDVTIEERQMNSAPVSRDGEAGEHVFSILQILALHAPIPFAQIWGRAIGFQRIGVDPHRIAKHRRARAAAGAAGLTK